MTLSRSTVRLIEYGILQVTNPLALICDLLVFRHFFRYWRQELKNSPHNHVIFALVIVCFTQKASDICLNLYYLRWGVVAIESDTFCEVWNWLDYSLLATNLHLLTWCCLERHLFVFYSVIMRQKKFLILFHYIPLFFVSTYATIFYMVNIFFDECTNMWDYNLPFCGAPCYTFRVTLTTFDWIFHYAFSIMLIFIVNAVLFIRIAFQKIRHRGNVNWRRQRKLVIQLICISLLFLVFISPLMIVGLIQLLWIPGFIAQIQYDYFFYLALLPTQFLPFIIVSSLPNMRHDIRNWCNRVRLRVRGRTAVQPQLNETGSVRNQQNNTYTQ